MLYSVGSRRSKPEALDRASSCGAAESNRFSEVGISLQDHDTRSGNNYDRPVHHVTPNGKGYGESVDAFKATL